MQLNLICARVEQAAALRATGNRFQLPCVWQESGFQLPCVREGNGFLGVQGVKRSGGARKK